MKAPMQQPLMAQARALLAQSEDDSRAIDAVLKTLDSLAARMADQTAELETNRATLSRLQGERARLADENQQLRDLLEGLLKTVESERRRRREGMGRIAEKLADLSEPKPAERRPDSRQAA